MAAMDIPSQITTPAGARGAEGDPFSNGSTKAARSPNRFSAFDTQLLSAYSTASPTQARRAIEAHLLDTDRRIRDASKLGTNLLEQKKHLTERLKDVEQQQGALEIDPDLRRKLEDLEREYNELGRESARAFIPRARQNGGTLGLGESETPDPSSSPSKLAPPVQTSSRKNRNASTRVEDLAFATEISTSLLGQVRHLQNLLADKEEALQKANVDNAKREDDARYTHLRLKSLDDNEQRYKDENWHLETQVQDLSAQLKDALARETKSGNALAALTLDKTAAEREYDELRLSHNKLMDDHASLRKKHDTETSTLRRGVTAAESEREFLHAKIAEITSQNEELARAVAFRIRDDNAALETDPVVDEDDLHDDQFVLDPSPPASPTKGTPRHGALESETLKSSLHHAHRMIQNLKNNIHREKTEKLELRRMLQDARNEVESRRADGGISAAAATRRRQAAQPDAFKKPPRPGQLGKRQDPSEEIVEDATWEDYDETPGRPQVHRRMESVMSTDTSDSFETANEAGSTDAFESAQSVVGDDSEGDQTETESSTVRKEPSKIAMMRSGKRTSFLSTASSEEDDMYDVTTPPRSDLPRYKLKMSRGGVRQVSGTPDFKDSPASFVSNSSSVATAKQDLAAELEDVDDASIAYSTPSRSMQSPPPNLSSPEEFEKRGTVLYTPSPPRTATMRPAMVDSGTLTDPWEPTSSTVAAPTAGVAAVGAAAAGAISGVAATLVATFGRSKQQSEEVAPSEEPVTWTAQGSDLVTEASTAPGAAIAATTPSKQSFSNRSISGLSTQDAEPVVPLEQNVNAEEMAPSSIPHPLPSQSIMSRQDPPSTKPLRELSISSLSTQSTEPVAPLFNDDFVPIIPIYQSASEHTSTFVPPTNSSMAAVEKIIETSPAVAPEALVATAPVADSTSPSQILATPKLDRSGNRNGIYLDETADRTPEKAALAANDAQIVSVPSTNTAQDAQRMPFQQVSGNGSTKKAATAGTQFEERQTDVSSNQIDSLVSQERDGKAPVAAAAATVFAIPPKPAAFGARPRTSVDTMPEAAPLRSPKRPASSGSARKGATAASQPPSFSPPPLPTEHRQTIAAASRRSSLVGSGPPPANLVAASAANVVSQQQRSRTPSGTFNRTPLDLQRPGSVTSATRVGHSSHAARGDSVSIRTATRRSSISSFASEVDERFNNGRVGFPVEGLEASTDPRMIQAITQTMIGEFMWKYTRKAGRGEHSANRHRRFFWIHPYTRTLYWSTQDPSHSKRSELKAKSVPIEAVRVVSDDNPLPPGLHPKSIVIVTPGRSIKFTAPTGMRHETWFNALSYLLLRTNPERANDANDQATQLHSLRSVRGSNVQVGSGRGSALNVNATNNYSDPSPSSHERSNTLSSLTSEEISEFNPTLHPRSASRLGVGTNREGQYNSSRASRSTERNNSALAGRLSSSQATSTRSLAAVHGSSATPSASRSPPAEPQQGGAGVPETVVVDADGFRVPPRPAGAQQPSYPPSSSKNLGSLSSRSRNAMGSIFSRSRSLSRTRNSIGGTDAAVPRQSLESASTVVPTAGGAPAESHATVENVRACCNGKHDVGSLSHQSRHSSLSMRHGL